jgi:signal transduction histidine kinase
MPQNSIWKPYLDGFIESPKYQMINAGIFGDYLGKELFSFFENLGSEIGTSILTKEKELQVQLLKNINLRLEQQQTLSNILIISSIIVFLLLVFILYLYIRNQKTTTLLLEQNRQIEQQKEDIRQKNEQLINRNAQLVTLNEEKNNLIRILAHDIRAPLGQIIMVADLVAQKMGPNLSEVETKMLTQVTANAERINQMVEKILDVDGIEEDKVKVLNERVDIRGVMKDVAHRYRPIAAKKNIAIDLQLCDNHYIIRTDHLLLLLVLENLVSNAVKFSQPNTKVILGADCAYDHVIFRVSDQGPGFTEEDKKKVFQRFQKLSAKPTAGESSTGLGLSIVKKYVSDLGGSVWLESEEGKGSTFYVKLEA